MGNQTMYCTDCHGSNTAQNTVIPTGSNPWGPHGSTNNFLLKGTWDSGIGKGDAANGLCFRCHNYDNYANGNAADNGRDSTGFSGPNEPGCIGNKQMNYHQAHAMNYNTWSCSWCHVAVPHGWKNKAFLVNLNDVGPEAGLAVGTAVPIDALGSVGYVRPPYYNGARLKVKQFAKSGNWMVTDCGDLTGNDGKGWMNGNDGCGNVN